MSEIRIEKPSDWGKVYAKATQILCTLSWAHDVNLGGREEHDFISKYLARCLDPNDDFWDQEKFQDPSWIIARSAFRDMQDYYKSSDYKTRLTREGDEELSIEEVGDRTKPILDGVIDDYFIDLISSKVKDNEDMQFVFLAMKEGHTKTSDIAYELGMDDNKVSKIRKNIRDRVINLYDEWRK